MRHVFFDSTGRLRNGWWALAFVAILVPFGIGQYQIIRLLREAGLPRGPWREGISVLAALGCTWVCTRLRREPLSSVGFILDRRWVRELGLGTTLGAGQMLVAVSLISVTGGVSFGLNPAWNLSALAASSLALMLGAVLEEVLFRGFVFQRLRDGLGIWPGQLVLGTAFALAHWGNPGLEGVTRVWATVDTGLGAIVLGLAYVRTGSLALPVGMHFGWNWMQGAVLGLEVSGWTVGGFLRATLLGRPDWLTGGAFGVEASVCAIVVDVIALVLLLRWKGSVAPTTATSAAPDTLAA